MDYEIVNEGDEIVDVMGSGDAPSLTNPSFLPHIYIPPTLSMQDIQDLILPDSVMELLPPLELQEDLRDSEISSTNSMCDIHALSREDNKIQPKEGMAKISTEHTVSFQYRDETGDGHKLNGDSQIYENILIEDGCTMVDLESLAMLFRCESCQTMPMSSETVHTCDYGHQVCGHCYKNGHRKCDLCRGPLLGNNEPLENILRRLHKTRPELFRDTPPPEVLERDELEKIHYSLRPVNCPEEECTHKTSSRALYSHFQVEHSKVPMTDISLFKACSVSLPKNLLENLTHKVLAVVQVHITDDEVALRLGTNSMICWVQCGTVDMKENKALVIWVSGVYDDVCMPPILYSLRAQTSHGYSSFGGRMIPLHISPPTAKNILTTGRCLLLLSEDIMNVIRANNGSFELQLTFYVT